MKTTANLFGLYDCRQSADAHNRCSDRWHAYVL